MTAATLPATDVRSWLSLHCFAYWPTQDLDDFLARTVAPMLDRLRAEQRIGDWFYIRYWEGGPHLRIRLRDVDEPTTTWLREELVRLLAEADYQPAELDSATYYQRLGGPAALTEAGWHAHGAVREIAYQPEIQRYGGTDALPIAEEVFCRCSEVAVRVVGATRQPRARLAAATDLTIATALALGLDRLAAARWLRLHAGGWRWNTEVAMLPPALMQERTTQVMALQAPTLNQRWRRVEELIDGDPSGTRSPVARWAAVIRDARRRLGDTGQGETAQAPAKWLGVWASQLHMLFNRMGITPDEERSVCWLVAATAMAPDGLTSFFADSAQAPDRRYQEASKYLPGAMIDQQPRDPAPVAIPRQGRRGRPAVPLPAHDLPEAALADVLRLRVTGRGRLGGPVTAADLGTLVWSAHAITHNELIHLPDGSTYEYAHRPYPSAGSRYISRLRLIARDVDGLEAGSYHVDPVDRVLWRIGPTPSDADLRATSMWFQGVTGPIEGIEIEPLPAMLALYVELGTLRPRYGMRALRFAVAEAGHLAQNLSLVAAATGLSVGLIGGFYDDVVHEVLGLDGVDNIAVYLLPVGRKLGDAQTPATSGPSEP